MCFHGGFVCEAIVCMHTNPIGHDCYKDHCLFNQLFYVCLVVKCCNDSEQHHNLPTIHLSFTSDYNYPIKFNFLKTYKSAVII